jgi:threonine dehydratase
MTQLVKEPAAQAERIPRMEDVLAAAGRIAGKAVRTPLLFAPSLSERLQARVYVKAECLQRTGSFKFRGAYNAIAALGPAAADGIVACSSGNHAQGIAEAGRLLGSPTLIVMPADAPDVKRRRTEASGARVVTYDRATEDRDAVALEILAKEGGTFVHPYNHPDVVAGQGTLGLEIAEDCTRLGIVPDVILVPCSGGGLTAGVALSLSERMPATRVYAVEPAEFDDYARSLAAGRPERNARTSGSICDALLSPEPGSIGWAINQARLAGALSATDEEALYAVGLAYEEMRLVAEPGGAITVAALVAGKLDVKGKTVVAVISGGNVADDILVSAIAAYRNGTTMPSMPSS